MAEPWTPAAGPQDGDQPFKPFDRHALEATLADALRDAESVGSANGEGLPAPAASRAVAPTPPIPSTPSGPPIPSGADAGAPLGQAGTPRSSGPGPVSTGPLGGLPLRRPADSSPETSPPAATPRPAPITPPQAAGTRPAPITPPQAAGTRPAPITPPEAAAPRPAPRPSLLGSGLIGPAGAGRPGGGLGGPGAGSPGGGLGAASPTGLRPPAAAGPSPLTPPRPLQGLSRPGEMGGGRLVSGLSPSGYSPAPAAPPAEQPTIPMRRPKRPEPVSEAPAAPPAAAAPPAPPRPAVTISGWSPADDDILPHAASKRRGRRR